MPDPEATVPVRPPRHLVLFGWLTLMALVGVACGDGADPDTAAAPTAAAPADGSAPDDPTASAGPTTPPTSSPTSAPTPVPTVAATPTPTVPPTPDATACLAEIPLEVLAGQVLVALAAPADIAAVRDAVARGQLGGVALLGTPTADDLAALRATDEVAGPLPLLIASDEEGGRVQRLAGILGPLPSAAVAATMGTEELRATYETYAAGLADLGVDMVFGPVVDVGSGPGIGDRSYGDDPAVVAERAAVMVDALQAVGVVAVLKHFPGHGRASGDTHLGFATAPPLAELEAVDLVPYRALLDRPGVAVMVAHLEVPGLTTDRPTSLAPEAIDGLLRTELGFGGLVVTDALGMGAVSDRWDQLTATVLALEAGADLAIVNDVASAVAVRDGLVGGAVDAERLRAAAGQVLAAKGIEACTVLETTRADPATSPGEEGP